MGSLNLQKLIELNRDISRAIVNGRSKEEMRGLFLPLGLTDFEIQKLLTLPLGLSGPRLLKVLFHLRLYDWALEVFLFSSAVKLKNEEVAINQDDPGYPYLH